MAAAGGQLVIAGTAVAVTVLAYLASKVSDRRRLRRQSPVTYLLAADRKLGGSPMPRRR